MVTHHNSSTIQNKDTITVHNCVKSMGDSQHCAVSKLVTNCCLDQFISPAKPAQWRLWTPWYRLFIEQLINIMERPVLIHALLDIQMTV